MTQLQNDLVALVDAYRAAAERAEAALEVAREMRAAQKRYFKERTQSALTESKRLERELDQRLGQR